jgi:hypothetical protein
VDVDDEVVGWGTGAFADLAAMPVNTMIGRGCVEAIEDEVDAEVELITGVVPRHRTCSVENSTRFGVLPHRRRVGHRLREVGHLVTDGGWEARLLQREPVDDASITASAWAVIASEKPPARRHPMTASWCRNVAGPGEVRDSIIGAAHGCRANTTRADAARCRIACFQSRSAGGTSISPNTTSTVPSMIASSLGTWWKIVIGFTSSSTANLRIVNKSNPITSASATAAEITRSGLRAGRVETTAWGGASTVIAFGSVVIWRVRPVLGMCTVERSSDAGG